VSLSKFL